MLAVSGPVAASIVSEVNVDVSALSMADQVAVELVFVWIVVLQATAGPARAEGIIGVAQVVPTVAAELIQQTALDVEVEAGRASPYGKYNDQEHRYHQDAHCLRHFSDPHFGYRYWVLPDNFTL